MNIVVVDDHPLARKGIIAILSENNKNYTIAEASSANETLKCIEKLRADVMIVDLKLGKEDGLDVIQCVKNVSPQTKFIILSSFISQADFSRAENMGIDGYVLKDAMVEDIVYIVDLIMRGKKYYDPNIISYCTKGNQDNNQINELSSREIDILVEMGKGLCNQEIANSLYISVNTVKKHISNILSKLNFKHRTQAALFIQNKNYDFQN